MTPQQPVPTSAATDETERPARWISQLTFFLPALVTAEDVTATKPHSTQSLVGENPERGRGRGGKDNRVKKGVRNTEQDSKHQLLE